MPAALLFDLDGTLVDSARDIAAALSIVSERRGGPAIAPAQVRPLVSLGAQTLVTRALGDQARAPVSDLSEFREVLADWPTDPASIYEGVEATLSALADGGHAMAIVTNKPEHLARLLLERLGLARWFGAIVGGDTLAVSKPDRAPLHHALALLQCRGDAVMIGDSDVDACAAQSASLPFILFEGGYGADACRHLPVAARYRHIGALPEILEKRMAANSV
ncbi:HAD family hydrolase [Sphingomonas sp. ABOLD]|uniref:HAD family hydrolase n=1 Tax=Sphingomonas sp. ABOLD TaxID=1985877 RepID=UPI000F7E9E22|nr:HAD-IA family hydrolase [Sphingomonas sp. ABOLD]RSV50385.1 HAD family hydrolase [Sphingomonas sp. ABOLD]